MTRAHCCRSRHHGNYPSSLQTSTALEQNPCRAWGGPWNCLKQKASHPYEGLVTLFFEYFRNLTTVYFHWTSGVPQDLGQIDE